MDLRKKVNLIIYRFREQGLEIFLLNSRDQQRWDFPKGNMSSEERFIELDPVEESDGNKEEAFAVEGDWHEIPSLKSMLYEDAMQLKEKLKDMEGGAYLTVKEALKKALPHQYAFLKELKDILTDRNSIRDL